MLRGPWTLKCQVTVRRHVLKSVLGSLADDLRPPTCPEQLLPKLIRHLRQQSWQIESQWRHRVVSEVSLYRQVAKPVSQSDQRRSCRFSGSRKSIHWSLMPRSLVLLGSIVTDQGQPGQHRETLGRQHMDPVKILSSVESPNDP